MKKTVIIINGNGGGGKDTICDIVSKYYKVSNVSSIDPIKKIASENGWMGEKNVKGRGFLAALKKAFMEFNDLPFNYIMSKYYEFLNTSDEILFVHIREAIEICKFEDEVKKNPNVRCISLLVVKDGGTEWYNEADDNTANYTYDLCYSNNLPLENLEEDFMSFFQEYINNCEVES